MLETLGPGLEAQGGGEMKSTQRKWQIANIAKGRCSVCARSLAEGSRAYCLFHLV